MRCPTNINNRFPIPCPEKYTRLDVMIPQLFDAMREFIPDPSVTQGMMNTIRKKLMTYKADSGLLLQQYLVELD